MKKDGLTPFFEDIGTEPEWKKHIASTRYLVEAWFGSQIDFWYGGGLN